MLSEKKRVKLYFQVIDDSDGSILTESMWGIPISDNLYELDNIPFYAYLFACGDLVKTEKVNDELIVKKLERPSGNSTIRVLLANEDHLDVVKKELNEFGCDSESSKSANLIAVNIPQNITYNNIIKYLDSKEKEGILDYEEACISEHHNNQIQ